LGLTNHHIQAKAPFVRVCAPFHTPCQLKLLPLFSFFLSTPQEAEEIFQKKITAQKTSNLVKLISCPTVASGIVARIQDWCFESESQKGN
jgi:hypothetical protein